MMIKNGEKVVTVCKESNFIPSHCFSVVGNAGYTYILAYDFYVRCVDHYQIPIKTTDTGRPIQKQFNCGLSRETLSVLGQKLR